MQNVMVDLTTDSDEDNYDTRTKSKTTKTILSEQQNENNDPNDENSSHNGGHSLTLIERLALKRKGNKQETVKEESKYLKSGLTKTKTTSFTSVSNNDDYVMHIPTAKDLSNYIKARVNGVKSKTFDLTKIPAHEIIRTGRTIKTMPGWKGLWPALREFMQNTIDHLNLLDHSTGRRQLALKLVVVENNRIHSQSHSSSSTSSHFRPVTYIFTCGEERICSIYVNGPDELVIEQAYTFPLPVRALDTGVPDTTKQKGDTAGGFGDGFKTAAVSLIALGESVFKELTWTFFSQQNEKIVWNFTGCNRDAVGSFAACQVLEVHISKSSYHPCSSNHVDQVKGNTMQQLIRCKDIGTVFVNEAVPKLQVFWNVNEAMILSVPSHSSGGGGGGDYIADALSMPSLPTHSNSLMTDNMKVSDEDDDENADGKAEMTRTTVKPNKPNKNNSKQKSVDKTNRNSSILKPCPGIYIKGIWVKPPKIEDTIMSFCSTEFDVSGRDRNDVDEEELLEALSDIICNCVQKDLLKRLMWPLLGGMAAAIATETRDATSQSSSTVTTSSSATSTHSSTSWLLRSPRYFNRIIEMNKEYILHHVFEFPVGSLFVSHKTLGNNDPFIQWAANFLKTQKAPLIPIETKGSLKLLFEEVNEYQLTSKCAYILLNIHYNNQLFASNKIPKLPIKKLTKKLSYNNNSNDNSNGNSSTDLAVTGEEAAVGVLHEEVMQRVLAFMGVSMTGTSTTRGKKISSSRTRTSANIVFSPLVAIAFVYECNLFLPVVPLTRDFLIKVLNMIQNQLKTNLTSNSNSSSSVDSSTSINEGFTSLIQALFELFVGKDASIRPLGMDDIENVLRHAKNVLETNRNFLRQPVPVAVIPAVVSESNISDALRPPTIDLSSNGNNNNNLTEAGIPDINTSNTSTTNRRSKCGVASVISLDDEDEDGNTRNHHTSSINNNNTNSDDTNTSNSSSNNDYLTQQINNARKRMRINTTSSSSSVSSCQEIIPSSAFSEDQSGGESESCLKPNSALFAFDVPLELLGGGHIMMDASSAASLRTFLAQSTSSSSSSSLVSGSAPSGASVWTPAYCQRVCVLRRLQNESIRVILQAVPSLSPFAASIRHGYDVNTTYEGFCNSDGIVINLNTFVSKLSSAAAAAAAAGVTAGSESGNTGDRESSSGMTVCGIVRGNSGSGSGGGSQTESLTHEFIITVTHELAHMLTAGGGHGQQWRDAHMSLLQRVYVHMLSTNYSGGPAAADSVWMSQARACNCRR